MKIIKKRDHSVKPTKQLNIKAILALICVVLIISTVAYIVFYKPKCLNQQCFLNSIWKCKKVTFLDVRDNATWNYVVQGSNNGGCNVYVEPIRLKTDVETANAMVGKSMVCNIPKEVGGSFSPETKIEYCHGELKEAIQDLIIKKMHLFIVQNIGQINQTSIRPI
jgi:hypothetical protein